jgi:hypothetical protein
MARKKSMDALSGTGSQLPDAKGLSPTRDARRRKGGAGVAIAPKGGGTGTFRKSRRVPE